MEMPPPDQESLPIREAGPSKGWLAALEKGLVRLTEVFYLIAGVALVGMLLLVVSDIIGIKVLSKPVPGGIEIVTFLAVVVIGFAISHTAVMHGHVAVDFVVARLPNRSKLIMTAVTVFFSVCLMALLAYYSFEYAVKLRSTGEVSMTQKIPFYPFVYGLAVCWTLTTLVLCRELVHTIVKAVKTWTP